MKFDADEVKKAENNVAQYLKDGLLKKDAGNSQFSGFYMENAKKALLIARHLQKLSTEAETRKNNGFPEGFECFLWVIVLSYYSMFYTANAALAKIKIKVGDKIAHKVTQDALVVYFIKNKKLAKYLLEDYESTKNEVLSLMGVSEEELLKEFQVKAEALIATFDYQRRKRGEFQYEIKMPAKENMANLALERTERFIQEMAKAIGRMN
ncbi:MAG: hypothetical protein PHO02_03250 [Candidatus Nanoarchaeia archaeon]|nr:hypothetical protein [Candidatus Nanoarchaeia archaeon]